MQTNGCQQIETSTMKEQGKEEEHIKYGGTSLKRI
jgi:hypothetical protein